MKRRSYLYMAILIAITSCPAWADVEYSDAVDHGTASHSTGAWQQLGTLWDTESGPWPNDSSDDGVSWSTDGGVTFGSDLILTRGQEVTFRFDMRRVDWGVHSYDQIKVWVDWNGDLQFDNTAGSNEMILYDTWDKGDTVFHPDGMTAAAADAYYLANGRGTYAKAEDDLQKNFEVTLTVPEYEVDDIWLRARVSCNHVPLDSPYGEYWQGEVEDWQLNVVPVPSGIILAGIGLAVAQWRLKRKESLAD